MMEDDAVEWHPYVYWRRRPHQGKYFQVDDKGIRHTFNSTEEAPGVPRIWTFGGSTMWGTGVRADYTIASCLSRELANDGFKSHVTNYGEGGYVSTQEVITLMLELQHGNVPDVVVFYDGFNEVATAFQNGKAGWTSNESNRVDEFNVDTKRSKIQKLLTLIPGIVRFAGGLSRRLRGGYSLASGTSGNLEQETVDVYRSNVRLVQALAKEYGFKAIFYWQPIIYQKDQLAPNELKAANDLSYMKDFALAVYKHRDALASISDVHDISEMFRSESTAVYADFCHLSERGNEAVAKRMKEDVKPLLAKH
jgi:hypothetical protein